MGYSIEASTYECGVRYNKYTGDWSCESGMLKTDTFHSRTIPSVRSSYSANNDSIRKGDKGAKGSWS